MPNIFISYRRADTGYVATMLAEKLVQQFGPNSVFFDIDNIPLGVDFRRHIDTAIARCDILLALVGNSWLNCQHEDGTRRLDDPADFLRLEIEAALRRNIPVIPILTDDATMPAERDLPESLRPFAFRNASELRSGSDLRIHLERLLTGLEVHFQKTLVQKAPDPPAAKSLPNAVPPKSQPLPTPTAVKPPAANIPQANFQTASSPSDDAPRLKKPQARFNFERTPKQSMLEVFVRGMFLLYWTKTTAAKFFQVMFFVGFAFSSLVTLGLLLLPMTGTENGPAPNLIVTLMVKGFFASFCWIPLFLFTWLPVKMFDE